MTIKSLLFILFLCICLVWVGAAYLHPGPDLQRFGLLWTSLVLIAALAAILGARLFGWWRVWRVRVAVRPSVPAKAAPIVHEDDAAMAALIAEANAALSKAPGYVGQRGKTPLSGLRLYLLIGPQGAGKTGTFLNSGVEPQLLAGQVGGNAPVSTRLCNLWLAKNAIFAEISGRAFSGEIGRWSALLGLLRGKASTPFWRRLWREPEEGLTLGGVIGFCDVKELTGASADPQRLERGCREWQERLRAIGEVFEVEFPVYQVFTKCDKIPFFLDFFGRLPESEVNQVLGCTLPYRKPESFRPGEVFAEVEAKRLTGAFRPLYHSLAERRLTHLTHEPNPARKPGIYEFPRELKRIRAPLVQFLTDVFRPHPLRPVPLLRGFYLTGVQEVEVAPAVPAAVGADWTSPNLGTEASRMFSGDATQIFHSDEPSRVANPGGRRGLGTRWIFVSDLFHQVVLADPPLIQQTAPKDPHFEPYRRGVFAAVCGLGALLCIAFVTSWAQNRQLLRDVAEAGHAVLPKAGNLATLAELRSLDSLRVQVERLQNGESISFHWGLYEGNAILDDAKKTYFRRFQQLLLNDLNGSMLAQLQKLPATPGPNDPDEPAYSLLKTHLLISSGGCKPDPPLVSRVLKQTRGQLGEADQEWQRLADQQIAFYVKALHDRNPCRVPEDMAVRDHTRQYLQKIKGVDRIYRRILADAEKGAAKPQRLEDLASNYKVVLNGPGEVSAAFTPEGWRLVQKASKEAPAGGLGEVCVVGNSSGLPGGSKQDAEVVREIQQRYIHAYIEAWQQFVVGFSVLPYKGAADAAQKLDILAGNRSPLLALLALTANQTNFLPTSESGVVEKAGKVIGDLMKTGEQKVNQYTDSGKDKRETLSTEDITRFFQPVRYVVPPSSERWINEKNTAYMDALAGMRSAIQAKSRTPADTPDPQLELVAIQSVDKAEESVRQLAKGFNPDGVGVLDHEVSRLLNEPIKNARPMLIAPPMKSDAKVGPELQKFCSSFQPVLRKYPFNRSALEPPSGSEVTPMELGSYFAPEQGAIWKFQKAALAEFTILEGGVWKQNPASQKLKASQELLDFLNRSQEITKAFFADGGTSPHLSYTLRPVLDENSGQVISLKIDGQTHDFSLNSMLQHQFSWPAEPGKGEAVGRSGTVGFMTGFSSHEGVWAAFRMFGDAENRRPKEPALQWMRTMGPTGRFQAMDAPVKLNIAVFPGGIDVFNRSFFEGLHCPSKAVQ